MPSATHNTAAQQVITVDDAETGHATYFAVVFFFRFIGNIFNLAGVRGGLVAPLGRLWNNYYPFGEEAVIMPKFTLTFIITTLLAFAEIKSQGKAEFPFQTHPQAIMVSVTSLLLYGFASAIELIVSAARLHSIYVMIAHLARIGSLCILVGSLASLFYFDT